MDNLNAIDGAPSRGEQRVRYLAKYLAIIAILSSAFHFWPFQGHKIWQLLCPMNSVIMCWLVLLAGAVILTRGWQLICQSLPHISVFAFLAINILSIAFAHERARSVSYVVKLMLMFVGAYSLFSLAVQDAGSRRLIYQVIVAAAILCLSACLLARYYYNSEQFGFFDSAYKYSTYIVLMGSIAVSYCLQSRKISGRLLGCALLVGMLITVGSAGAIAAITISLIAFMIVIRKRLIAAFILISLLIAGVVLFNVDKGVAADLTLAEDDHVNLRQRYIEWQAEINLLEKRIIPGTGAGGINTHRSSFYYRLPKLNTLQPFDQNGWLACAAEIGVVGLVCLCWIVLHYGGIAVRDIRCYRHMAGKEENVAFAASNLTALIAACIVNVFSSFQYNGVLIVLVLLLSLIPHAEHPEEPAL